MWIVAAVAPVLALAVGLSLWAMSGTVTYFFSPSEVTEQNAPAGREIRLGGLVEAGSVEQHGGGEVVFAVTDNAATTRAVNYWWGLRSGAEDQEYQEALPSGTRQLLDLLETLQGSDNVHIFPEKLYDNEDNLHSPENRVYSPKELMEMDWLDACVHGKLPHYDELDVKTRTVLAINGLDNVKGLEK